MASELELPGWVPGAVGWLYLRFGNYGGEIGRRLLFDPRMEKVWSDLRSHGERLEREEREDFKMAREPAKQVPVRLLGNRR